MARHRRPSITAPLAFWTDTMLAATATVVTLSVRLPQIAAGTMTRSEAGRMVGEKLAAAAEGTAAAATAALRVSRRRGRASTPLRLAQDMIEVAEAASRPARRRVKANARRLTRTS